VAESDPTWSVGDLHAALNEVIEVSFGSTVWVAGELRSLTRSHAGHAYFDLVDPEVDEATAARLSVTLFNGYRQRVNATLRKARADVAMEEGTVLRIEGELRTYPARSRLQLVMTGIDPTYTIGVLTQQRERALAALAADDLLERNAGLEMASPALRLAVVTSRGSAAQADVLEELRASGFGFDVSLLDARTQGSQAETTLVAALRTAAALPCDAVLLVRGGGSRSDLAPFDSELVGRTIATLDVPVLTGIGHETDTSVADVVAHQAYKTPTACAAAVVAQARHSAEQLSATRGALSVAAHGRLQRSATALSNEANAVATGCRSHLGQEERSLEVRTERLAHAASQTLARRMRQVHEVAVRLHPAVDGALVRTSRRLDHASALAVAHDPELVLARGWSITRDEHGRVLRSTAEVREGSTLWTQLSDGRLRSEVIGQDGDDPRGGDPT
jgi:exodeoxyribonuclease VII large subunit